MPHRSDDAIRQNADLSGRLSLINIEAWKEEDLKEIALKGFKQLNMSITETVAEKLAVECLTSPQLMQYICLSICILLEDKNEIQILVSTTVVEVGVNVPNATVMMVENAERFGLAQLHQLRGRVGRGEHQSYCIFMQGQDARETKERLEILVKSNDGFEIAGEDLRLRGPGDLFGIRQSGDMEFALADIYQDAQVVKKASEAGGAILKLNTDLSLEQPRRLRERLLD